MEWQKTIIFLIKCSYYAINEIKHEKSFKDSNRIDTLGQILVVFPIIVILLNIKLGCPYKRRFNPKVSFDYGYCIVQ